MLAQLSCEVRRLRRVPRYGVPPGAERAVGSRGAAPDRPCAAGALRALVHAGFAHRRKALAGSLALAQGATDDMRQATRAALEAIGQRPDARAERLAPDDWPRLAEALGAERLAGLRARSA